VRSAVARSSEARIPSLDGLRALSISLVLIGHLAGTRNFPLSAAVGNFWALGEFGVRVFFVISGFLITGILLDEQQRSGRISLRRFYFRRTLRIFPPYFALLAAIFAAAAWGTVTLAPHDVAYTVTYTSNYYSGRSWFVGHTWSLGVEEQFYLLWPAVLMLAGRRKGLIAAALFVLACPVIRVGEWELFRGFGAGIGNRFETIGDAIAAGCLLAGLRPTLHALAVYRRVLDSRAFIAVPAIAILASLTHEHPLLYWGAGMTVANIAIALSIDWSVTHDRGIVGRMLNARAIVLVGWLSYSVYLWQQPFLDRSSASPLAAFPLNILLAIGFAVFSYVAVERPALGLRRRIESGRRRGRAADAVAVLSPAGTPGAP
jgi:peptidoglycan/LPS O-acetylase OafA/YrhL